MRKTGPAWLGIAFVCLGMSAPSSWAKELQGRLGLGYNAQFANYSTTNGTPAVSIKYGMTRDIAAAGLLGFNTNSPSNTLIGLKGFKNIFYETNLNFYFLMGFGFVSGSGRNGLEFLPGFGTEFFIPGVESLGFSTEVGASFTNLSGSFAFRTIGVSFLNAGIHFYF